MAMSKVLDELLMKKTAALTLSGKSNSQIAKILAIAPVTVAKIHDNPQFKEIIRKEGDEIIALARSTLRSETGKLANEMMRVIREELAENSLEAVKLGMRILGMDQQEERVGETNLTVIMPGATSTPVIDVKSEISDVALPITESYSEPITTNEEKV